MAGPAKTKSIKDQTLEIIANSNLPSMSAAAPKLMVGTTDFGPNILGAVDRRLPNLIQINENLASPAVNAGMKHTMQHEFEHILQNQAATTYGKSYDTQVVDIYKTLGGTQNQLISYLEKSAASDKLQSRLETLSGTKVAPYLGKMTDKQFSLREQFAELSSLEKFSGKDLTKDPVIRKEFFGDDQAFIDTYKATTGFRTTRTDSKDLPPMTPQVSVTKEPGTLQTLLNSVFGGSK